MNGELVSRVGNVPAVLTEGECRLEGVSLVWFSWVWEAIVESVVGDGIVFKYMNRQLVDTPE